MKPPRYSLGWVLAGPFMLLSVVLAASVGAISYAAGTRAVNALSEELLGSLVQRTGEAIEGHVHRAGAVLEAAFPVGLAAPSDPLAEIPTLRTRFWIATSMQPDPNQYVYFATTEGRYLGLIRHSPEEGELLSLAPAAATRTAQRFVGIAGALGTPDVRPTTFDPRERPWYRAAIASPGEVWTPVYVDYGSQALVATRARQVFGPNHEVVGVVATDLSLQALNDFLKALPVPAGGVAYVVEPGGALIATSKGEHLRRAGDGVERVVLAGTGDSVVEQTFRRVRERLAGTTLRAPGSMRLVDVMGEDWETGFARVQDSAGLDWAVVVAVPRSVVLADIPGTVWRSIVAALLAGLVVLSLGALVLRKLSREVAQLAAAVHQAGEGDLYFPVGAQSIQELDVLARSFEEMQRRLRTDVLTGLATREAVNQRLERRLKHRRRADGDLRLAVLFVDLDGFKGVNDRFGHDAGDVVLSEMGRRLRRAVRESDLVARWAGDEYLILLDGIGSRADADIVRAKIEASLREPVSLSAATIASLGGTVGVGFFPDDGQSVDALVAAADADMYTRKKSRPTRRTSATQ